MGFEYFYGFVGGDASQWQPNLFRNTTPIYPFQGNPGWNLTTAMADEAIQYMKQLKELAPEQAVLRLLRAGRHPRAASSDAGVDRQDRRHASLRRRLGKAARDHLRQPEAAGHHARERAADAVAGRTGIYGGAKLPRWDSLDWEQKKLFIKQADVYGAYQAYTDHEIGRVIQAVEDLGQLDNTLIIYISGDNGASAEGMLNGTPNEFTTFNGVEVPVKDQFLWYEFWGSERTFPHFSAAWAWAFDTPFKWMKQVPSHFGGTAQGVAMSWPGHINDAGGIRRQFHHVIDIVPTILEATGIPAPDTINGIKQLPIEGVSMAYTWDKANANAPTRHTTQYFEMLGNRAIYHDGWVACTTPVTLPWELSTKPPPDVITGYKWELYNVDGGSHPEQRPGRQDAGQAQAAAEPLLPRGGEVQRAAARQHDARALELAEAEPDGGANDVHLLGRTDRRAGQHGAEHPEQVLHHHRRGRRSPKAARKA